MAGKMRFLDCRQDEQERQITMKASTIALRHICGEEEYVLNLIDSPGHVDFSSEVSTAVRLSDGGFLVVDAVDGVATQTRAVLAQAYREKVKCCLVINKVDLLITTKGMDPPQAYLALAQIVQQANVIMAEFVEADRITGGQLHEDREGCEDLVDDTEEQWFEPAKGNVVFASAIDGWGFTPHSFARLYAKKLNWSESSLTKALWGEWYLDTKRKKIVTSPPKSDSQPMCVKFVLEQIWKVYNSANISDVDERMDALLKITNALGLQVRENVLKKKEPADAVAAVMNGWLPLSRCLMNTCVKQLPSPLDAQPYRVPRLLPELPVIKPDALRKEYTDGLLSCSKDSKVMVYIAKMFDTDQLPGVALQEGDVQVDTEGVDRTAFVGVARIFSGSIKKGDKLYVLDPKHQPGGEATAQEITVTQLFLLMGKGLAPVESITAGAIFGIGGLGASVLKSATLASSPDACGFSQMVFQSSAVIRMSIEPFNACDLDKLKRGLALLNKADPQVEVVLTEQGELVICTAGEVHAERCVRDLTDRYAQVGMRVSEPIVGFKETIVAEQKKATTSTTANKQCSFSIKAYDIPQGISDAIEAHQTDLRALAGYTADTVRDIVDREDLLEASRALRDAFQAEESRWGELWERGLWSLGPKHCGTCLLACTAPELGSVTSVWCALSALLKELDGGAAQGMPPVSPSRSPQRDRGGGERSDAGSVSDMTFCAKTIRQINDSIVAGFQLAVEKGPLCDEPMTNVAFVVTELRISEEDESDGCYGPLSGQAMSAVYQGCRQAFMAEGKRLVEPLYECDIVAATNCHRKVYDVLKKRRAEILDNIPQEGTMAFRVIAYLPVTESFGLADELRIKTSGNATPTLCFSHWQKIDTDPFFVRKTEDELEDMDETDVAIITNIPRTLINKVRRRKGLAVEDHVVKKAEKMKYSTRAG
eukprot:TRINITY_DN43937_c0_g1_i1.p1 TRINITY_DN43937_c0_g1~~TRINITY_DN43937_c0_g1_i1.p1  ORF type:complete len:997 (+),score=418.70 TRINITY_DN43937_c0_g1_i1:185-2992(+)